VFFPTSENEKVRISLQRKTQKVISTSPSPALRRLEKNRWWLRERVGVRVRASEQKGNYTPLL